MPLQIQGNAGVTAEVETNTRAIRTTLRPIDVGALGSYRVAEFSGLMATIAAKTATAGHIFAWRWGDATRFALLKYLKIRYSVVTGFTAAQELGFDAIIARGYTVSSSAGTAITLGGNSMKKRTSMGASLLTDARIAAAVALTAGTHTLDGQPIVTSGRRTLAAAATVEGLDFEEALDLTNSGDYPYVFAQNEGIIVRNNILMGAGGTVRLHVQMAWDEVAAY
jgi:hypothetical protein